MRYHLAALALAVALAAPGLCLADPPATTPDDAKPGAVSTATAVTPLVVEATRLPTYETDVPDIQVIDRAEIDALPAWRSPVTGRSAASPASACAAPAPTRPWC